MTISRTEAIEGLEAQLQELGDLIGGLDEESWNTPTRCEGWSVADVSAHAVGTFAEIAAGRFEGLGTPEVTSREVVERKGRTPAELVAELNEASPGVVSFAKLFDDESWEAPAPGGYEGTIGMAVEALLYDTYLHTEDIRAALGMDPGAGAGLRASVHHVAAELASRGFGPATVALEGIDEIHVGDGVGPRYEGDPLRFVLAVTGRGGLAELGLDDSANIYSE
jgi:uncharacterized protein (TIGR03083 family)